MLIFDRESWKNHRSWCAGVVIATFLALAWYVAYGLWWGPWNWPGGASPPGFTFGLLGGAIILFEMLLWPRKSLWRGWRLLPTKTWMIAHLWLGLFALPLLLLHGSFHFHPAHRHSRRCSCGSWRLSSAAACPAWSSRTSCPGSCSKRFPPRRSTPRSGTCSTSFEPTPSGSSS